MGRRASQGGRVGRIGSNIVFCAGFDPFFETQKGLAELIERETVENKSARMGPPPPQQPQDRGMPMTNGSKMMDMPPMRPRMPPPGFNHMNGGGGGFNNGFGGMPRNQPGQSKMLPFMQQQQQSDPSMSWNGGYGPNPGAAAGLGASNKGE